MSKVSFNGSTYVGKVGGEGGIGGVDREGWSGGWMVRQHSGFVGYLVFISLPLPSSPPLPTPSAPNVPVELGCNAPFIVFNSADIPLAVKHALFTKYRNAGQVDGRVIEPSLMTSSWPPGGQTCICTNRLLIQVCMSS